MALKYADKLRGKSIVIVGGTSGVGFAAAEASLEFGASVVVVSRTQENVDKAVKRLQASYPAAAMNVRGYACDISSDQAEADISRVFDFATDKGTKPVDHVISTAGSFPNPITLAEATPSSLIAASQYHFIGDLMLAKVAVKYLRPGYTSSITLTGGAGTYKPPPRLATLGRRRRGKRRADSEPRPGAETDSREPGLSWCNPNGAIRPGYGRLG